VLACAAPVVKHQYIALLRAATVSPLAVAVGTTTWAVLTPVGKYHAL